MSILLCLDNGDLDVSSHGLQLVDGQREVLQLLRNILKMNRGSEPLNTALGVPYFDQILEKGTADEVIQGILYQVVSESPGVLEVLDFNLVIDKASRTAALTFTARTETGIVTTTETFP